ncbi:hypothetical protein [Dyadobacter sp. 676]|uniref:Uncharacterized protein n=1 Tax=Dyadobacter sp. 676 TaxID=3088362 RepID=A0AAU8FU40_9BACT
MRTVKNCGHNSSVKYLTNLKKDHFVLP